MSIEAYRRAGLFIEDFDAPATPPPVVEEPPAEPDPAIAAAWQEGREAGFAEGLAQARVEREAELARLLGCVAAALADSRAEVTRVTEESTEACGRMMLAMFRLMLPALCARHGAAEIAALLGDVLPRLHDVPEVVLAVNPRMRPALEDAMSGFPPEQRAQVRMVDDPALALDDARASWTNGGNFSRYGARARAELAEAMRAAGIDMPELDEPAADLLDTAAVPELSGTAAVPELPGAAAVEPAFA